MTKKLTAVLVCAGLLLSGVQAAETPVGGEMVAGYVALTFDDGPSGRFTARLLDGLAERGAAATFFLCGYRVEQFPELMTRYAAEGHEIGIHGYSHDYMHTMSRQTLEQELTGTAELIADAAGVAPVLMRPPGGLTSDTCRAVADEQDLVIILWSVDPEDWHITSSSQIVQNVLSKVQDGDVVLLHDMSDSSVDAALEIVDTLQSRGFRMVTVSELAILRGKTVETGKIYGSFYP